MKHDKIIQEIQKKHKINIPDTENKTKQEIYNILQHTINKLYEKKGATQEIIQFQADLNTYKTKNNLIDTTEIISVDDSDYYVQ